MARGLLPCALEGARSRDQSEWRAAYRLRANYPRRLIEYLLVFGRSRSFGEAVYPWRPFSSSAPLLDGVRPDSASVGVPPSPFSSALPAFRPTPEVLRWRPGLAGALTNTGSDVALQKRRIPMVLLLLDFPLDRCRAAQVLPLSSARRIQGPRNF